MSSLMQQESHTHSAYCSPFQVLRSHLTITTFSKSPLTQKNRGLGKKSKGVANLVTWSIVMHYFLLSNIKFHI